MDENQVNEIMANQSIQGQANMNALQTQQQVMFQEQERGLAEEQLDVNSLLLEIFYMISGKKITFDNVGERKWEDSDDLELRVFSQKGIQLLMKLVTFYINKNTLLSYYLAEEIDKIMFDVTTELNDLILTKYEDIFYEPSFEELQTILKKKMEERRKVKEFVYTYSNRQVDKEKVDEELSQTEEEVLYELDKIRTIERKKRIKEYGIMCLEIEHQILNTYKRAQVGKERDTLRRHSNFSEIRTIQPDSKEGGVFNLFKSK